MASFTHKAKGFKQLLTGETLDQVNARGQNIKKLVDNPWNQPRNIVDSVDQVPKGKKAIKKGDNVYYDERNLLTKVKDQRKNKQLLSQAEDTANAVEKKTRLAQGAVAVPVAVGAGVGANEIYKTKKKDKKILNDKAKQIYRAGETNVVKGMLHDPRFPLGAKLRILEGEGVIKTSSVWSVIKGTKYKAAKDQWNQADKALTATGKKIDGIKNPNPADVKKHDKANEAWEAAKGKAWKEGFKTWSSRIGLGGAAAAPVAAVKIKEANLSNAGLVGVTTGTGALTGAASVALNPKLPDNGPTWKELLEGAGLGAGVGLGVGAGAAAVKNTVGTGKFKNILSKNASLDVSDIERRLGPNYNLGEDKEKFVRRSLGQHKSDSFILQHPYLTGIPTLGLAPAIKQHLTKDKVVRQLAKNSIEDEESKDVYRLYIN